jgi:hypothetical protein
VASRFQLATAYAARRPPRCLKIESVPPAGIEINQYPHGLFELFKLVRRGIEPLPAGLATSIPLAQRKVMKTLRSSCSCSVTCVHWPPDDAPNGPFRTGSYFPQTQFKENKFMRTKNSFEAIFASVFFVTLVSTQAWAFEFDWSVANPFRFYRNQSSFDKHLKAFDTLIKANGGARPADIIRRMERELNSPGCTDQHNFDSCATSKTAEYFLRQQGWAARSHGDDEYCYGYDTDAEDYQFDAKCKRNYSFGAVTENFINPTSHVVKVTLPPAEQSKFGSKECVWRWDGRQAASAAHGTAQADCDSVAVLSGIPYPDGANLTVTLPDGSSETSVIVVKDVLVIGFGDSFAAGEGNPDRPVTLHPSFAWQYGAYAEGWPIRDTKTPIPTDPHFPNLAKFYEAAARWVSPNCHRSQYSHQFRVAMQLAVENPHAAVTFVHLACSGAEITEGLFGEQKAREHLSEGKTVQSQVGQLFELLCEGGPKTFSVNLKQPVHYGFPGVKNRAYIVKGCDPANFRRKVDLALMTFGGNDIGFSALVGNIMIKNPADVALALPAFEALSRTKFTFGPEIAQGYLDILDGRFAVTKKFFNDRLGLLPEKVVQTGYVSVQRDENGNPCAGTTGLDVHPKFGFIASRLKAVDDFSIQFFSRMNCIASTSTSCKKLDTDPGTGFQFVTSFQPEFVKRGVCSANGSDERKFAVLPKIRIDSHGEFTPWNPSRFQPYFPRQRLSLSPNDAMLTANTHEDGNSSPPLTDIVQLMFASVYSGAFHPSAEGQAIMADAVYPVAAKVVGLK